MEDRLYQENAFSNIRTELVAGVLQQLIVMATGTGKTFIFANLNNKLADLRPGKTLILAHREELIDQAITHMKEFNPFLRVDKEMAEHHADPSQADVVVASVATLGRKGTKRLDKYDWSQFDKIITDEAHHSLAQSYLNIYEAVGLFNEGCDKLFLGFTATPQRGDGQALAKLFKKISFVYSIRQAIQEGWLVDVRGYKITSKLSLDDIKTVGGDFEQGSLAETVNVEWRNKLCAEKWLELGEGLKTIGFAVNIKHAQDLAQTFRDYGIDAAAVWGNDPERELKLKAHRAGEITVLFNVDVLTEGYDDWTVACIINAAPTKSPVKFIQRLGRMTRLQKGTGNLLQYTGTEPIKRYAILLDMVDSTSRHSLITLPTLMGLAANLDLNGKSLVGSVMKVEAAQAKFPHLTFDKLDNIDNLESFIEKVNLFDVKFAPEVESNSEFSWYSSATGGFIIRLTEESEITIRQNILDKWELSGIIKGQKYKGERDNVEDIFLVADKIIREKCPEILKLVRRIETWHDHPATTDQLKLIKKLYPGQPIPFNLTKGQASKAIGLKLAGKAKK